MAGFEPATTRFQAEYADRTALHPVEPRPGLAPGFVPSQGTVLSAGRTRLAPAARLELATLGSKPRVMSISPGGCMWHRLIATIVHATCPYAFVKFTTGASYRIRTGPGCLEGSSATANTKLALHRPHFAASIAPAAFC